MKFELIGYPQQIVPGNEYYVNVEVTPELFGLITDDWIYFHESGIETTKKRRPFGPSGTQRRTTIHHKARFNKIYSTYTLSVLIKPQHISKLTELNMVLAVVVFNGPYDPILATIFGAEGVRIHYTKEGDTYYPTGEIEKSY